MAIGQQAPAETGFQVPVITSPASIGDLMTSMPDIPAFLRIPAADRAAAWRGVRLTNWAKVNRAAPPSKTEEAATRKLRREIEAAEKAKRDARFAALRERYGR